MNSTVRPIFNKSFAKKISLLVSWTVHKTHWKNIKCSSINKKRNADAAVSSISKYTNGYLDCNWHTSPTLISMSNLDIVDYIVDYALLLYDIDILFSLPEI